MTAGDGALVRIKHRVGASRRLSPKHKALADFVLKNPDQAAFLTAAELAAAVGVSDATVIRFATWLGYPGYKEFQQDFQHVLLNELTTLRRWGRSLADIGRRESRDVVLAHESVSLEAVRQSVSDAEIKKAASWLVEAEHVIAIGTRASRCLADYFAYQASQIVPVADALTSGGVESHELLAASPGALVVVFAFERYPRETVEMTDTARHRGLRVIGITDSIRSPLAQRGDLVVLSHASPEGFLDLLAAPMAIAGSIILEASRLDGPRTMVGLNRFEQRAESLRAFWSAEDERRPAFRCSIASMILPCSMAESSALAEVQTAWTGARSRGA